MCFICVFLSGVLPDVFYLCEVVRFPGTGVTDGCELPCGSWELNQGPLKEQPVLLTTKAYLQQEIPSFTLCSALLCRVSAIQQEV